MNEEQIDNSLIPDHQRINNSVEFEAYTIGELFSKKSKLKGYSITFPLTVFLYVYKNSLLKSR